jgi:hypothetical protein
MTTSLPHDAGFLAPKRNYSFVEDAIETIREVFSPGTIKTADAIRSKLESVGLEPDSPNGWGPIFRTAVGRKLLIPTGRWACSGRPDSRSRKIPEYVVAR